MGSGVTAQVFIDLMEDSKDHEALSASRPVKKAVLTMQMWNSNESYCVLWPTKKQSTMVSWLHRHSTLLKTGKNRKSFFQCNLWFQTQPSLTCMTFLSSLEDVCDVKICWIFLQKLPLWERRLERDASQLLRKQGKVTRLATCLQFFLSDVK